MFIGRTIFGTEALFIDYCLFTIIDFNCESSSAARLILPLLQRLLQAALIPFQFEDSSFTSGKKRRPGLFTQVSMAIGRNRCGGRAGKTQEDLSTVINNLSLPIAITNSLFVYTYFRLSDFNLSSIFRIFLRKSRKCIFIQYL